MYNCVVLHNPNMSKLGRGTWAGTKKKRNKQTNKQTNKNPMYPVQYLCNNTTTRVPSPGPTTKFVGTMAQDSIQKRGGGEEKLQKK